jgi:aminoglycoside phosphotransferase (APT) family kinase protein
MVDAADGLDLHAVARYLIDAGTALDGPLRAELVSGGRSNLTYLVTDGAHDWVVRRPPMGEVLSGAHDVAREHRVMSALTATTVPVPKMVALCTDDAVIGVPFYIMDRIPGLVLRTTEQVQALAEPVRHSLGGRLVDTLADLHDVDYEAVGLGDLGRPDGYLQRQIDRWARQYEKIKIRELPNVPAIVSALRASRPASSLSSIVHGDYRLDNVIVDAADPARIAGVLDWEMATLGDPLADLATLVMFWDEPGRPFNPITGGLMAQPGFFGTDEVIERYVTRRGLDLDDIDWYVTFSQFKLAVILEQIHARYVAGQTLGPGFNGIGDMVLVLLSSAMDAVTGSKSLRPRQRRPDGR